MHANFFAKSDLTDILPLGYHDDIQAEDALKTVQFNYLWRRWIIAMILIASDRTTFLLEGSFRDGFDDKINTFLVDFYSGPG